MRDAYWRMLTDFKHKEYYYQYYSVRNKRVHGCVVGICLMVSLPSIAAWVFWDYLPWLWAALVSLAQILQAVSPYFPFVKRNVALGYLLPALADLMLDVESGWREIDINRYDDEQIHNLIDKHKARFNMLENRYIKSKSINMPMNNKRCDRKAKKECKKYYKHHFDVEEVL